MFTISRFLISKFVVSRFIISRFECSIKYNYFFLNFRKYPVDIQECPIQLESWGHPAHVLRFFWNREDCVVQQSIKLNQHNFQVVLEDQEAGSNFSTGIVLF